MAAATLNKYRDPTLDILKGLAILNIVVIHTVFWSGQSYIPYDSIRQVTLFIDVPLFFFLSGWAVSISRKTFSNVIKQYVRLFSQYAAIVVFLFLILATVFQTPPSTQTLLQWLLLQNFDSGNLPVVMASMWFLVVYLVVYLTAPLGWYLQKHKAVLLVLIAMSSMLIALFSFTDVSIQYASLYSIVNVRQFVFYATFFFLGFYSKDLYLSMIEFIASFGLISVAFIVYLSHLQFSLDLQGNKFPPTLFYFIASLFAILIAIYAKNYTSYIKTQIIAGNKLMRFLNYSGKNYFAIYLSQGFGASLIIPLSLYLVRADLHWAGILIICFIVNIVIAYSIAFVFIPIHHIIYGYFSSRIDRMFQRSKNATNFNETLNGRGRC